MSLSELPEPRVLISRQRLANRVTELAAEIERDYAGTESLIGVGILKGSVFFMVDLLQQVDLPLSIDFFQTSSYGSGTVPGEVRIRKDLDLSIRDRHVLLIEDIVDTGFTLRTIMAPAALSGRPKRQAVRPTRQGVGSSGGCHHRLPRLRDRRRFRSRLRSRLRRALSQPTVHRRLRASRLPGCPRRRVRNP